MNDFAFSSTAFRKQSLERAVALAASRDWILEFSSGIPHSSDMVQTYLKADCRKMLHNYFPAPQKPFVLNLASLNADIFERSLSHALSNLELTRKSGARFYSIHAGFCLDPKPSELGGTLSTSGAGQRQDHWTKFISAVNTLAREAAKKGVQILIENNVVTAFNVEKHGHNPLLCVDSNELKLLVQTVNHPALGILIDTGHWKVSADAMGFELASVLDLKSDVLAFHHSDNDGRTDSNHPLTEGYWLLPLLKQFTAPITHVLEVHDQTEAEIERQRNLLFSHSP